MVTDTGLRIAAAAARSGFSPATLRYYDSIGLVAPAGRTESGYRLYLDRDLERLRFVARAKELGCSLEEIAELLTAWDDDCGDVRVRLHHLVADKIVDAQRRITELVAFAAQLRTAAALLDGSGDDGPCGNGCGCMTTSGGSARPSAGSDAVAEAPGRAEDGDPAITCTLDDGEVRDRIGDWQAVLAHVTARTAVADGLRLELGHDVAVEELAGLARAEQRCCNWVRFSLTLDDRGVGLEVRAPSAGADALAAMFGVAD